MDLARLAADGIVSVPPTRWWRPIDLGSSAWNPGAERIFGHRAGEAVGQSLDLIIPERLRAAHWKLAAGRRDRPEPVRRDGDLLSMPAIRKDGERISVEFTMCRLMTRPAAWWACSCAT